MTRDWRAFSYFTTHNFKNIHNIYHSPSEWRQQEQKLVGTSNSDSCPLPEAKNSLVLSWLEAKNARRVLLWLLVTFLLPLCPPRWKPLPGSYLQGHDQVWEALGHPMGGVTRLTNPPLSASSQLLPNVSSKTPRLATCWQPISWESVYAGPLLLISLVVTHNLTIKSHSKCSLLLSGKITLGPWETKDREAIVFGWLC